jgi:hypothetical protein
MVRDWSPNASYVWTPSDADPGSRVGVWVRVVGQSDHDHAALPFPIEPRSGETQQPPGAVQITSLTSDLEPPQSVGTSITFTVATSGGGTLEYRWWIKEGRKWTMVRDWSPAASFAWTPSSPDPGYKVGVWVRSVGHSGYEVSSEPFPIEAAPNENEIPPTEALQITGLTADLPAPQPAGTSISFTVETSGGEGVLEYRWWIKEDGKWTMAEDWGSASSFVWMPLAPNPGYKVGVWVRIAGAQEYEVAALPFPISQSEENTTPPEETGTPPCGDPDLIFCEDWEDGDHAGWDWSSNWDYEDDGGVKCGADLIRSGTSAFQGSCAIHLHFNECVEGANCSGGDDGADAIYPSAFIGDQTGPIVARFAIKYSDEYKWNAPGSKVFYLRSDSGGYFSWAVQLGSRPEDPSDLFGPGRFYLDLQTHVVQLGYNVGSPHDGRILPGQWHEVQIMAKPNSHVGQSDGEVKLWINGALVMHYDGLDMRSNAFDPHSELNRVWISAYIGGPTRPHPPQDMWYDSISVSPGR